MIQINSLLLTFLAVFLLRSGVQVYLQRLNLSFLRQHGTVVPEMFRDAIDPEKLKKISAYTADSENFHLIGTLVNQGIFLIILLSGFLPWLAQTISMYQYGRISSGLIFFAVLSIIANLLRIPFSLYETFVIEERHGFNVMSLKTWISDLFKGIVITAILGGLLLGILLGLVIHGGDK
ncbi:MAG TPA: M48 family peptidase, partial [Thermodesulfobacteriota bacterium]|nr:M48 family peptidase [Thermodesulfobacteriota bacterium]